MSDTPENKPINVDETAKKAASFLFAEMPPLGAPPTEDEKLWGMLGHLSALIGAFGIPGFFGPLAVWLMKKDESRFVHFHALQNLFLHIAMLIVGVVLGISFFILVAITAGLAAIPLIGVFVLLGVAFLVYVVMVGVKAKEGKWVAYPYVGKMAYDKVMAAPEPKKPGEAAPAAPAAPSNPPTPPSNPA